MRLCTDTIAKHLSNSPLCSDPSVKSPVSVVFYIYLSKSKNIYLNPVVPTRGTENLAFPWKQFSCTKNESLIFFKSVRGDTNALGKISKNVNFELKFVSKHYLAFKITNAHWYVLP